MKKIFLLVLALAWCVLSGHAQTRYWVAPSTGNWNDPANWGTAAAGPGGAGVPAAGMNVSFTSNFNGDCILDVAPTVTNITLSTYTGTIDLNGNNLNNTGTGTFTSGTISNTGAAAFVALGGTTYHFNGTLFNADVIGSGGILNFSGSTFNGVVNVAKTGAANDNGLGGSTFNGPVTLTNTGGSGQIQLGNTNPDIFNGMLTINSNGTSATHIGRAAAGNLYNQNIVINYNATGTVAFGQQGGTGTLAAGRTITVGAVGASGCGNLILEEFTATSAQTLTLSGNTTAVLTLGPNSTFGHDLTATSPGIILNASTFQGTTQLIKTGATDDGCRGGNVFNGIFTCNNNGTNDLRFGSNAADAGDVWNADATFNNTSGARIRVGEFSAGNVFFADVTFNALGGGTDVADRIQISRFNGAETTFNGTTTINNLGATSDIQISFEAGSLTTFNGPVFYNENATGAADDYIGNAGNVVFTNDLTISNTSTNIVYMSAGTGTVTFGNGTLSVGTFNAGQLRITNFTQTGTATSSLSLTNNAGLRVGPNCAFGGNVDFRAPQLWLDGATYSGSTNTFEKTGAVSNTSNGGNTFNGTTTITNSGTGFLLLGNSNADQFNGPTTFNNTGAYRLYFAHNHPGQTTTFASSLTINSAKSSGTDTWSILMAENGASAVSFGGAVTINCSGSIRSDFRMLNGTGSTAVYNGVLTVNNTNSHAATTFSFGTNGTSTYNENIVLSNVNGPTQMLFNVSTIASSQLAAGKTITIGGAGFVDGTLSLPRFTQLGTTPQTLNTFTGTASLIVGPNSAFGGNVDFKAPQVYLNGCNYGGTVTIEKTGATDNAGQGGNTFGGVTTITNSGSGYLMTGNGKPDTFNGATTFNNVGSDRFYFAQNHPGQTTTFADDVTLNSNKSAAGDTWSFFYGDNGANAISFGGNVTINCQGNIRSDHRFLNGTGSSATYAGTLTINNTNTNPATVLSVGLNGTSTYNGNIAVSNTGAANAINFNGSASASSTLAAGRTISIGGGGFASGTLSLPRFTQVSATPQTLLLTGTALLVVGPASSFDGNVDFRAPQIQLQGCTYNGTALLEKTGATDNNCTGGNTFQGVTTINNSGTGYLQLGSTNADQFNGVTTFNVTGTNRILLAQGTGQSTAFASDVTFNSNKSAAGDQYAFQVCEGNNSQVTFGGNVTINCQSAFRSDHRFLNGTGSNATFAGALTINLSNSHGSTAINMGANGVSTYNGNISVTNSGGAAGVFFNTGSGASSTLAATKTITIGGGGFPSGTLSLVRFTQVGNTAQTLNVPSSGTTLLIVGPASAFGGNVDFRAPQVLLNGCTYSGNAYIEKNGATDNTGTGGDTFHGVTTLVNSGSGSFELANTQPETFNGNLTVNNTGTYRMQIGINAAGTVFNGTTTFNHNGTASASINFIVARNAGSSATFNGPLFLNNANGNSNSGIIIGNDGTVALNNDVTVSNTGSGRGIFIAGGNGSATLNTGFTIKDAGTGTFTTGALSLTRFTQLGNTAQEITLTGNAIIAISQSQFNGTVNFKAPQLTTTATTYNNAVVFEKTGGTDNASAGGNTFNSTATITNSGTAYLMMGNGTADTFIGNTVFNNTGTYRIYIAQNHAGQTTTFANDLTLNSAKTGGADAWSYLVAENNGGRYSVGGTFTINCTGTLRSDHRFLNSAGSTANYAGDVVINSTNSHSNTVINMGVNGTSTYSGNIVVTNVNGGTSSGIFFNTAASSSSTLAAGRTISIGGAGFTGGTLSLMRFTQIGATPQPLTLTGTATITTGPSSSFDGNVDFRAPQVLLNGATFNGTANFEKNGAGNNDSSGGNIFNGETTITNSGTGRMRLASTNGDTYNTPVTFVKTGSGVFEPAYNHTNAFAGDITTNGATSFILGSGGGVVEFSGTGAQAVNLAGGSIIPIFQNIRLNKTSGALTLNTIMNVGATASFTAGIINTSATNYLNFANDATASGANDMSYVNGPVRKTGNDAFTFPVGADNFYRPIGISAPGNTTHAFTAQFFHAPQGFGDKTTWDPSFWTVSACDYWTLDRSNGSSNVSVTLSWNEALCGGAGYITSLPGLRVTRWSGTNWVNHGNGGTTGTTGNGTVVTSAAVTAFSPFALASVTRLNPLPVELTAFKAKDLGATVSLDWTTASELNSESFTVQRSQTGLDFEDLTTINGAGTKTSETKYNFIDESPYSGLSYYRLKQTDYNGDVSYPGITSIRRNGESAAFHAYPNPAGNEVVYFTQKANITIINSLDQQIGSAQGVTSIDVSGLKAGVYIIRNQNGQVVKLVKK